MKKASMKFDIKLQIRDIESKRSVFKSAGVLVNRFDRNYWEFYRTSMIRYKAVNSTTKI